MNPTNGYVKIHRALMNHWLWNDLKKLRAWLYLLFAAAWEPETIVLSKGNIHLERGQLATSIRKLMAEWGYYSEATIKLLNLFESHGMIEKKSSHSMTIITIVNYDKYQLDAFAEICMPKRKSESKSCSGSERSIYKEEKNKEEDNNLSTLPREKDLKFFEDLNSSDMFVEESAMLLKKERPDIKELLMQFRDEMLAKEHYHDTRVDYKQHFINWVKYNAKRGAAANSKSQDNAKQKEDKFTNRRPGGVTNLSGQELKASFLRPLAERKNK